MVEKFENSGEIEQYAAAIEKLGKHSNSTEALAVDSLNYLYNRLNDGRDHPCALVRFFRTIPFNELTPGLQEIAIQSLQGEPTSLVNCLTLLASRGMLPEWNDRCASLQHQVIPLSSVQMVEAAPMIAQLIKRLGIEVAKMVKPAPTLFLNPKDKEYNVLYVPEALGENVIVAQEHFVIPHRIRSVVGFGGLLPTGDMFAVMMFMRVFIPEETAKRFGLIARGLEVAINEVRSIKKDGARILVATGPDGASRVKNLLGAEHRIMVVDTIEKAITAASSEIFDMIVCGTAFDESRMFELLQAVKQNTKQKPKPFVCIKQSRSNLGQASEHGVSTAARMMGASCYLDATGMTDNDLLQTLEAYLPKEIWMEENSSH
jgi:hypothetical protein